MTDPKRLIASAETTEFEKALVGALREEALPPAVRARLASALGFAGGLSAAAAVSTAQAATSALAAGAPAAPLAGSVASASLAGSVASASLAGSVASASLAGSVASASLTAGLGAKVVTVVSAGLVVAGGAWWGVSLTDNAAPPAVDPIELRAATPQQQNTAPATPQDEPPAASDETAAKAQTTAATIQKRPPPRSNAALASERPSADEERASASPAPSVAETTESPSGDPLITAEVRALDSVRSHLANNKPLAALEGLRDYRAAHPAGALGLEAEALHIEALAGAGSTGEAQRRGQAFLNKYANAAAAARVRRVLARVGKK